MRKILSYKKLPTGFTYVLTKKHVREIDEQYPSNHWVVSFDGIAYSETKTYPKFMATMDNQSHFMGTIYSARKEGIWRNRLRIEGVRASSIGDTRESLGAKLQGLIAQWARALSSQPSTSPDSGYSLFLRVYDIASGFPGKASCFIPHDQHKPLNFVESD